MSTASSPATGPRAMAEQNILKIIWPPDGRPTWEDRHKIPPIERALNHLLDVVEGAEAPQTSITVAESQALTEKAVALRQQGMKLGQIGDILGLTAKAVSSRLSDARKKQTILRVQTGQRVTFDGKPAALRSAAPNHIVEANEMVPGTDSVDGVDYEDLAAQPKVEQVSGQTSLQEARPEQNENSTIRKDRMVEESEGVGPGGTKPDNSEKPETSAQKPERVPLTDEQKAQIMELHGKGNDIAEIKNLLGISDGRLIQGTIMGSKRRKTAENVPAVQSSDTSSRPQKDVMLLQQPANVADTSSTSVTSAPADKPTEDKPAPKAIGRVELDAKIWTLWKEGKSPAEISDIIWDEGYYYSEKSVTVRLRSQGADI